MAVDTENPTLAWARAYLKAGLKPFPLAARSKVPPKKLAWKEAAAGKNGAGATDEDLERWFIRPGYNIALAMGGGVIAVDLDGPGAEERLADAGVVLPDDAPRSETSNGAHVLLRVPGPVENRVRMLASSQLRPGTEKPLWQIDIRADGGYIAVAPSIHPDTGKEYRWVRRPGGEIPDAPQALLDMIRAHGASSKGAPSQNGDQPKWVAQAMTSGAGEGQRDDLCAKLAGYFLGKNHPADIVKSLLYSYAEKCRPPFPRDQVDKTVDSVTRKDAAAAQAAQEAEDTEFQALGYDHDSCFYLPRGRKQVIELRAEQHTKLHLLKLAPLQHWEQNYANRKGVEWDMAANALMQKSQEAGIYDPGRVRGRGAWWDEDRQTCVLHVGDALVIGDRREAVAHAPGARYVYEAAPPIEVDVDELLDVESANTVMRISELCPWEKPISARLFAGWTVVAPVCGALVWRPHVWLTGGAGTGKSTIMDSILRPLLGDIGLAVQSETTEAGIRQTLGQDARPVTFDEIDAEDPRGLARIQNVLALARQASSEGGACIVKGSAGGTARAYRVRSCFAFSSIGVTIQHFADATRVTTLGLVERKDQEAYARLQGLVVDTLTRRFCRRWVARSIRLVPAIRANAETFALAGAAHLGSRRLGDQLGALLAGAYSLYDEGLVSPEDARAFIEEQDWEEQRALGEMTDEQACLQRILEHVLRVTTSRGAGERSVAELIRAAAGRPTSGELFPQTDAAEHLGRVGIRVDLDAADCSTFTVSNSHAGVQAILRDTKWAAGWARILKRIPGARVTDSARFCGTRSRGVELPLGDE